MSLKGKMKEYKLPIIMIGLIAIVWILMASIINVPAGHKAVATRGFGIGEQFDEGWQFKNPLTEVEMVRYNTQEQSYIGGDMLSDGVGSIMVVTNDNVYVFIDMTLVFHIDEDHVSTLRVENGPDWKSVVVDPIARSYARDVAADYSVIDIAGTGRDELGDRIEASLAVELAKKNIILEDFSLRDIRLPDNIRSAIEEKKSAEQNVLTQQYNLEAELFVAEQKVVNAKAEKNVTIINAEGKRQAIDIVIEKFDPDPNSSLNETERINNYLTWLYIQALSDPNSNIEYIMLPSEGGVPVILDLQDE